MLKNDVITGKGEGVIFDCVCMIPMTSKRTFFEGGSDEQKFFKFVLARYLIESKKGSMTELVARPPVKPKIDSLNLGTANVVFTIVSFQFKSIKD